MIHSLEYLSARIRQHLAARIPERVRVARARAAVARLTWERHLAGIRAWRKLCLDSVCDDCGYRKRVYYEDGRKRTTCHCRAVVPHTMLRQMIRRLAGLHPGRVRRRDEQLDEWSDWGKGKPGRHGCGPGAWDNAVRAAEEG